LVTRLDQAEDRISEHDHRLRAVETALSAIQKGQADTLAATRLTQKAVTALVPEVLELRRNSKAAKVVKKSGLAGLFMVIGGILEQYGPALVQWFLRS
jgi:hypothetical protein